MIKEISIVQQDLRHGIYAVDVKDEKDNCYRLCFPLPPDADGVDFHRAIAECYLEESRGFQFSPFTPEISRVNEALADIEKERLEMFNRLSPNAPPRSSFSGIVGTVSPTPETSEVSDAGQE